MMYWICRIGIVILILFALALLLSFIVGRIGKKTKRVPKYYFVITLIICGLLFYPLSLVPFENLVRPFDDVQKICSYYCEGQLYDTVTGTNSSMILTMREDNPFLGCYVVLQDGGDYLIPFGSKDGHNGSNQVRAQVTVESGNFTIVSCNGTDDCYAYYCIFDPSDEAVSIEDSCGSEYKTVKMYDNGKTTGYIAYAWIPDYTSDYQVTVNGSNVSF